MFKNEEFSKTCLSQIKWWGYEWISVTKFRMIMKGVYELWKWLSFWKREKCDELREFLELNEIKLGFGYVWTTVMICDICTCFVNVFEYEYLVFCALSKKRWFYENRRTLSKCGFMIG